jgi:hypothetical protein
MPIRWHPHLPICRPDFQNNGFRPIFHTAHNVIGKVAQPLTQRENAQAFTLATAV